MNHIFHTYEQVRTAPLQPGDRVFYHHPRRGLEMYPVLEKHGLTCLELPLRITGEARPYWVQPKHFGSVSA